MKKLFLSLLFILSLTIIGCGQETPETASTELPAVSTVIGEPSDDNITVAGNLTLAETLFINQNGIEITATGLSYNKKGELELNCSAVNHYSQDIFMDSYNASINEYMVYPQISENIVKVNEKINFVITFSKILMDYYHIKDAAEITVLFSIEEYDGTYQYSAGADAVMLFNDKVTLLTSAADTYVPAYDHNQGEFLYEQGGLRIAYKDVSSSIYNLSLDNPLTWAFYFYLDNTSSDDLILMVSHAAINGNDVSFSLISPIFSGKAEIANAGVSIDELAALGINNIEDMEVLEVSFTIFSLADPLTPLYESDPIIVNLQ